MRDGTGAPAVQGKDYGMGDTRMDLTGSGMVALTRDALAALRNALMRDTGYAAAGYLQEAGYAGGAALFGAFSQWLAARGAGAPSDLSITAFQARATEFFRDCGWGALSIGDLHDTVATLDSSDWGEATPDAGLEHPGCHLSSGMFADFFGRVADAPLAVMEVECRSAGAERCRFLLGSPEVLQQVYEGMAQGAGYEEAVSLSA
ncbi:MAG: V4R domain-containing protein [Gemmatimonadota bacterium]